MTFESLLADVGAYGAAILLPLSILEGPIVTILAGYASRLGMFQVPVAFVIVVLGDLIGDAVFYFLGMHGVGRIPQRWREKLGLMPDRVAALSEHFDAKGGRTLILAKITHSAGAAVMVAAGFARMNFPLFMWYNLLGTVPKSAALLALGYVLGEAATQLGPTITEGSLVLLFLIIVGAGIWWVWGRKKPQ